MDKKTSVDYFAPALDYMIEHNTPLYPPESFKAYRDRHKLPNKNTIEIISINSLSQLKGLSKRAIQENAMPLRLGSPSGTSGTQFTVVKVPGGLNDFFLLDSQIFVNPEETFIPTVGLRDLYVFNLLPSFSENTLVNLALASGLIHHALKLDLHTEISSPITGYSTTFEFEFRPHSSLPDILHHSPGQVEIDAAFLGCRQGKEGLFIIEAKSSNANSLSKHKLLYPILSLIHNAKIPPDMPIIPVYMKVFKSSNGWNFNIVECSIPDPRLNPLCLDQLVAKTETHANLTLPLFEKKDMRLKQGFD